jgi:hypothetical protein
MRREGDPIFATGVVAWPDPDTVPAEPEFIRRGIVQSHSEVADDAAERSIKSVPLV